MAPPLPLKVSLETTKIGWLTSTFVTVIDISATVGYPEPGGNSIILSKGPKGSFRSTHPQTGLHSTKTYAARRGGGGALSIYTGGGVPRYMKKGGLRHGHNPKKGS